MSAVMDEVYGELNELCRNKMEQITIKDVQGKLISNRQNLETMAGDDE